MKIPQVAARVIQRNELTRQRIHGMRTCGLAQRTGHAGQCQILEFGWPTETDWMDMIHMKNSLLALLRQAAILTAVTGTLDHLPAQGFRDAHAEALALSPR